YHLSPSQHRHSIVPSTEPPTSGHSKKLNSHWTIIGPPTFYQHRRIHIAVHGLPTTVITHWSTDEHSPDFQHTTISQHRNTNAIAATAITFAIAKPGISPGFCFYTLIRLTARYQLPR